MRNARMTFKPISCSFSSPKEVALQRSLGSVPIAASYRIQAGRCETGTITFQATQRYRCLVFSKEWPAHLAGYSVSGPLASFSEAI